MSSEERFEAIGGFKLSGSFAGEIDDSVDLSGGESLESDFPGDAGFAIAGGGFEENDGGSFESIFEVGLNRFLTRSGRFVSGFELEFAQSGEAGALLVEVGSEAVEVIDDERVVLIGVETDALDDTGGDFDEEEIEVDLLGRRFSFADQQFAVG